MSNQYEIVGREQSAALTNAIQEGRAGPYRVYFAYGKWRVSHGGSTRFLFSAKSEAAATGYAESLRGIYEDDGFTLRHQSDRPITKEAQNA